LEAAVVGFAPVIIGPLGLGDEVFVGIEADETLGGVVPIAKPSSSSFFETWWASSSAVPRKSSPIWAEIFNIEFFYRQQGVSIG